MAIAQDATSSGTTTGTSLTIAHTVTGANTLLVVAGLTDNATNDVVSGITYNGNAMTRVNTRAGARGGFRMYMYYILIGTADGNSHNIVVSTSTSCYIRFYGASYTGAKQSAQPDAQATSGTSGAQAGPLSNTLTTVADNSLHLAYVVPDDHAVSIVSAIQVVGLSGEYLFSSDPALVTPAGSNSVTTTWTSTQGCDTVGASFAPFVATTSGKNFLAFM